MKHVAKYLIVTFAIAVPLTGALAAQRNVYFLKGKVIPAPAANAKGVKDCVKIPCPEGWKPTTVCWECKDRPTNDVAPRAGAKAKAN